MILAIPSDSTIRRSLSFTHLHTGQGVQEQSEIPTLVDCVKTTISAYVVSSSKASHTLTRLPGFGASMFGYRPLQVPFYGRPRSTGLLKPPAAIAAYRLFMKCHFTVRCRCSQWVAVGRPKLPFERRKKNGRLPIGSGHKCI